MQLDLNNNIIVKMRFNKSFYIISNILLGVCAFSFTKVVSGDIIPLLKSRDYSISYAVYNSLSNSERNTVKLVIDKGIIYRNDNRVNAWNNKCKYWRQDTCYIIDISGKYKNVFTNIQVDSGKVPRGYGATLFPVCDITIFMDYLEARNLLDSLSLPKFVLPANDGRFQSKVPFEFTTHYKVSDTTNAFVFTRSHGTFTDKDSIIYQIHPSKQKLNFQVSDLIKSDSIRPYIRY